MTETRDKLNAFIDSLDLLSDSLKEGYKLLLDDLEEEAFERGQLSTRED